MSKTPQDAPEDFDLDAWIDDASLPEVSVTVVGKGGLKAEHQRLEDELRRVREAHSGDDRLVDPSIEIARQLRDISEQMRASERTFRFRALSRAEAKAISSNAPKDDSGEPDADYVAAAWLAASSVSPTMTAEQVQRIRDRIGEGQFNALWTAAWGVSNERKVDVPFSLAASVVLNQQDS